MLNSADQPGSPNIRLSIASQPENVMLVRQMLAGMAEAIDVAANDLNDITTAVTEACNNVVLHAYPQHAGPLQVEVHTRRAGVEIAVRDRGTGIQPSIVQAGKAGAVDPPGIGLSVIEALCQRAEFRRDGDRGTEVRMTFATPQARALEPISEHEHERPSIVDVEPAGAMEIAIAPIALARTVLPRLLSVAAARAHFTTDRLADAQLVSDTLTDRLAGSISGSRLRIAICAQPRELQLRLAPLPAGSANRLIVDASLDGLGSVIEKLSTDYEVATAGSDDDEMLALRLVDQR